jgi:hypothetical protein
MHQFRAAVTEARGGTAPIEVTRPDRPTKTSVSTYVVQPGDSWWKIAELTMGDPARNWPALADANGGADRELHPGQVLRIPGGKPTPPAPGIPPFPGEAELGDRGPVVLAWQEALIAHGVIRDNADNRDQHYGTGMRNVVERLQRSWDWSDADGVAGRHTWSKLHGGP